MITLIAATDLNRGIGLNGKMPWHLPEDLEYFRKQTVGHNIIMGNNTFKSIGRALPDRLNVVVTRDLTAKSAEHNVNYVHSMEEAWLVAGTRDVFVIGGAQVYSLALPRAEQILITEIDGEFGCDTFFPRLGNKWYEQETSPVFESSTGLRYRFLTYKRR